MKLPTLSVNASSIGRTAAVSTVAAEKRQDGPTIPLPAHVRAVLNAPGEHWKADGTDVPPTAYVSVYPVASLRARFPNQPNTFGELLNTLLSTLTGIRSGAVNPSALKLPLPYFPAVNATQVVAGAVMKVQTPEVVGVRYLTYHAQAVGQIPGDALEYTFQGLTRDGKNVVSVHLPYTLAGVPTQAQLDKSGNFNFPGERPGMSAAERQKVYDTYNSELTRKLNAASLSTQDAVVRSIRVR
ncbi:hypothetical protein [Deinococcus radiodurans]|uniref:hypothetical protein n=1 Tax=Deinococcus radiodurans TaxID=1299 RepID=UPI0002D7B10F|nr:hypothetical protein [Deinococcus radiodurans]UTA51339.1 DUF4885 domain-containing protein [Deinococcus radiodurans]